MSKERILIVDDEKNIVSSLQDILKDEGYEITTAEDGITALEMIQADPPELILLDIWIPGMDGIEVLKTVKTYHPEIEVLVMSGHGTVDTAVKATKLGAYDFIEKPFSLDELVQSVEKALQLQKTRFHSNGKKSLGKQELPHCFQLMVDVKRGINDASKNNEPVIITGEIGTAKEFIAQAIHNASKNSQYPLVKVNCAIRTKSAVQSELFITNRKSKTDNKNSEPSYNPRSIYLKNIEGLNKTLQEKLAEVLAYKGSEGNTNLELLPNRIFASTTQNLQELVDKGKFNKDLYQILNKNQLTISPLRENSALIPNLVEKYFAEQAEESGHSPRDISEEALKALMGYEWPENLKELRKVLDQLSSKVPSKDPIRFHDLPESIRNLEQHWDKSVFESFDSLQDAERSWEREFIIHHLRKNKWNLDETSKTLKTDTDKLKTKLQQHNIVLPLSAAKSGSPQHQFQRTLKRSVVLCGHGLHSGIKTGLIMQPMPPGSGIVFGDISSGDTIPARLENVQSTDYATCLKKGYSSVLTIEHIMATLHMYRISNLLIKISDEAPVMDGSAKDFCQLIEDGEFEEQDELMDELIIDKTYSYGAEDEKGPSISIEPYNGFKVSYHMEYPAPIGVMDHTFEFVDSKGFKEEIAPARTFGFVEEVAQLTKMGFGAGGKLDNFILLGDQKVLNTKLRYENEFARHKILDILGDFYLLGRPIRGYIKAHKSGHTQNIGLLKQIQADILQPVAV